MLTRQVKLEINKKLKLCQQNLKALGAKRQTPVEQIQYLMGIAMEYQKLSGEALLSNYRRTDVFDQNPTLRLATAVVNRSNQMSDAIATKGHTFHFEARLEEKSVGSDDPDIASVDFDQLNIDDERLEGTVEVRTVPDHPELEDLALAAQTLP